MLSGPFFGVFDHKLLAHPTATQVWQWSANAGRFVITSSTVTPPQNLRQAVNQGETFLHRGDYAQAAQVYREAIESKALDGAPETDNAPDWAALPALRLGQAYALDGNEAGARTALQQAAVAGGSIGQLADAFLTAYRGGQTVANVWVRSMKKLDLNRLLYQEQAGNLGFPMDAFNIYYPGLAVAGYLDSQPEAESLSAADMQAELKAGGRLGRGSARGRHGRRRQPRSGIHHPRPRRTRPITGARMAGLPPSDHWRVTLLAEGPQLALEKTIPLANRARLSSFASRRGSIRRS